MANLSGESGAILHNMRKLQTNLKRLMRQKKALKMENKSLRKRIEGLNSSLMSMSGEGDSFFDV